MTACDDPEFHYRFGIGLFIDGVKAAAVLGCGVRADRRSKKPLKRAPFETKVEA